MLKKSILNDKILNNKKIQRIPLSLYKKFVNFMPICCVDMVFNAGKKVYLFKRAYEPAKNEYWLIGGRILKGESLKDAVIRKAKEEVGVDVKITRRIGVYESFFKISRFDTKKKKYGAHAISICFLVQPKNKDFKLSLNDEYSDYKIIANNDKKEKYNLHPYVQAVLRDGEVWL